MKKIFKIILVLIFTIIIGIFTFAKEIPANDKELIKNDINKFFEEVRNINIEGALAVAGYKLTDNNQMKYIDEFFNDYPESKKQYKEMIGKLSCEIIDIKESDDSSGKIICKLKILYPNIEVYVKKARVSIIFNNLVDFLSGNITNKNVASIINSIYKEFLKDSNNIVNNDINITLKKQGNKYIIYDINELISNIQKYISEYSKIVMGDK